MKPKYLVRPNDFSIFELDETNGCYRSWSEKSIANGTRPNAMTHFTLENLTKNYGFLAIEESELETYKQKSDEYYKFLSWQHRPDGHGGSKGGSYEEYMLSHNRKFYCQSDIEDRPKCTNQCEHCKEYYKPLE